MSLHFAHWPFKFLFGDLTHKDETELTSVVFSPLAAAQIQNFSHVLIYLADSSSSFRESVAAAARLPRFKFHAWNWFAA